MLRGCIHSYPRAFWKDEIRTITIFRYSQDCSATMMGYVCLQHVYRILGLAENVKWLLCCREGSWPRLVTGSQQTMTWTKTWRAVRSSTQCLASPGPIFSRTSLTSFFVNFFFLPRPLILQLNLPPPLFPKLLLRQRPPGLSGSEP